MNGKATYEHLIAGKLEALPVPDMADAIWARIEAQLDLDLPADEGDVPVPEGPAGGGFWSQAFLFVAIVAILSLFTLPPKKIVPAPTPAAPQIQNPLPDGTAQPPPVTYTATAGNTTRSNAAPGLVAADGDTLVAAPPPGVPVDSAASPPVTVQQTPTVSNTTQDTIPKKRPRGVTGISDNDYRIVPKRDSSAGRGG